MLRQSVVIEYRVRDKSSRDAPVRHWPIISRPIISASQSANYGLIQKVTERSDILTFTDRRMLLIVIPALQIRVD